ncbi:MAG: transcriptional regulator [Planctomycetes bacterium]|nr:transcriptional regulator [Planctomycetota bacterium]
MARTGRPPALEAAREEFLAQWGALGSAWGVNRTMSRIHALLMVSREPLTTDDVMAELDVSRGNAHKNLKELVSWGLVRPAVRKGERKDYYEAEKDAWKVVRLIARQRRSKEVEPAVAVLADCLERTKGLRDAESVAFRKQLGELHEFATLADSALEKLGREELGKVLPWLLRFLK